LAKRKVIIVGAGTAGLIIAQNLQQSFDVTVIDKCNYERYPFYFRIPLLIGLLFRDLKSNLILKKTLRFSSEREIPFFESNVVGGSSEINGCVHTFGSKYSWEPTLKKFDIAYSEIIESFDRMFSKGGKKEKKIHLKCSQQTPLDHAFLDALTKNNIQQMADAETSDSPCAGPITNTCGRFFRSSVSSITRESGRLVTLNEHVTDFIFNEDQSVGGVVTDSSIHLADLVILAAGTVGTSALIAKTGLSTLAKGFDSNPNTTSLKDHVNLRVNVTSYAGVGSINEIVHSTWKKLGLLLRHLVGLDSLMSGTGATSAANLDVDGDGIVDTRINLLKFSETGRHASSGMGFHYSPGFSLSISQIQPVSSGNLRFDKNQVSIEPNYLSKEKDMALLLKALNYSLNLLKTPPLSNFVKEIEDERLITEAPRNYIMQNTYSGHHLIGGLAKILDENFRLLGCKNLYICDASVLESFPASNIHSSVVLLADIFSRRLQKNELH